MVPLCLIIISLLAGIFYTLVRHRHDYWKRRKVPYIKPVLLFGNYKDHIILKRHFSLITQDICRKFPDAPYIGTFLGTEPALIVEDPALIRTVTTTDFYYFNSREVSKYSHKEVLTQNLFFTYGDRWKVIRQNLTPMFSSSKMRNMFYLIKKCSTKFESLIDAEVQKCPEIEVSDLSARFTIESISSCAFGIEANTMGADTKTNPFKNISKQIIEVSTLVAIKSTVRSIWPWLLYSFGIKVFNQHVNDFFHKLLTGVFESRQYKPTSRNDFIDLLLNLKIKNNNTITGDSVSNLKTGDNKKVHLELNDELLVSQGIMIFFAGNETSAFTLAFTLYELAKHQEAQNRAIAEVDDYLKRHANDIEYDCVTDLPYLAACVDEALRLYPVLGVLTREVVDGYTLPTGLRLEKDLRIHIPVRYLHYHPDYFPEPEKYRPERFLGEAAKLIKSNIYMPFGEGQRICIGLRFAKIQLMVGLIVILKKCRLELAADMPRDVQIEPRSLVTQPVGGIRLRFVPRDH